MVRRREIRNENNLAAVGMKAVKGKGTLVRTINKRLASITGKKNGRFLPPSRCLLL